MSQHQINYETCTNCGLCVDICPSLVYRWLAERVEVDPANESLCGWCAQCMSICPTEAVTVQGFAYGDFAPLAQDTADYEPLLALMRARRTCRRFTDEPIPQEALERILEAARTAPMGMPPSIVEVVVINGRDKVQELIPELVRQTEWLGKALKNPLWRLILRRMVGRDMWPEFHKFASQYMEPMVKWYKEKGVDAFAWNCHAVLLFHAHRGGLCPQTDCDIACAYAMLAGEALGLGTGWNGMLQGGVDQSKQWKQRLGIPERNKVYAALTLGYPAHKWARGSPWKFKSVRWL